MTRQGDAREFLRRVGLGAAAVTAASIPGCSPSTQNKGPQGSETAEIPTDSMTTRHNPTTGDDVSLLGYGCMRWPTIEGDPDDKLDQEEMQPMQRAVLTTGILGESVSCGSDATISMAPAGQWRAQLPHSTPSVSGTQFAGTAP